MTPNQTHRDRFFVFFSSPLIEELFLFEPYWAAPLDYAKAQHNLGMAYGELPTGDRTANLERAIAYYQESLRFWTPQAAPQYGSNKNSSSITGK
jgi:hypothetical protein